MNDDQKKIIIVVTLLLLFLADMASAFCDNGVLVAVYSSLLLMSFGYMVCLMVFD